MKGEGRYMKLDSGFVFRNFSAGGILDIASQYSVNCNQRLESQ